MTTGRRPGWRSRIPWLAVVAFGLTTFALLAQPLLGLRTFGAVDLLENTTPYRESLARKPDARSWLQTDQVEGFPEKVSFWQDLRHGHFQAWSPRVAGGTPTGVFPFNAILSPFSIGFAFLPAWYALGVSAALALLVSQMGMYLFLRRLGVTGAVAVLGAVAYTFSGANVVNFHRVTAPFVVPLLLWAMDRLVERPSWRRAAVVGSLVAWSWLEGFPFAFVVCIVTAVAWGLWRAGRQWWRARVPGPPVAMLVRRWAWIAAGVGWGLALAAFSIAPTLYEVSRRGSLDIRDYTTTHLASLQLMGLFNGRALGRWQEDLWTGVPFITEASTAVGLIVIAGAVLACVVAARRRLRLGAPGRDAWGFWIVTAGAVTLLTYANTPLLVLAEHVPGLAHNNMGRARFLIPLGAAVVAALGLDAVLAARVQSAGGTEIAEDGDDRRPTGAVLAALALMAGAGACTLVVPRWLSEGHRLGQLHAMAAPLLVDVAVTAAAMALVAAAVRRRRLSASLTLAVVALLWVQLAWPLREVTPAAPVSDFYRVTAAHRAMAARLGGRYRFVGPGLSSFYSGSSQVFGIDDLRGFALRTTPTRNLILAVSSQAFDLDPLKIQLQRAQWNLTSPVLDDLAVRYYAEQSVTFPIGVVRRADPGFDRWVPATDPIVGTESLRAGGPVMGTALAIRTSPSCSARRLTVSLHSGGQVLGTASRPASDAVGGFIPFAIDGQAMRPDQPYGLSVEGPGGGCTVEVGVSDRPAGAVPATWEIGPDPALPLRLVSATDGWIYERATAWPLVSAHTRWRAFGDQASLLTWLAQRPQAEADVAGYVGPEKPSAPAGAMSATVGDVRWHSQSVELTAEADTPSLAVVSQNADPGWSVRVDGRAAPLVRVDGALQGVFVPAGRHRVVFSYTEPVLRDGLAVSGLALLGAAAAVVVPGLAKRRLRSRVQRVEGRRGDPDMKG